jgi:hypothetical protein
MERLLEKEGIRVDFPLRSKAENEVANQEAGPALNKTGPLSSRPRWYENED